MFVKTQAEFESLCEKLSKSDLIAIDTEFLREKTYYAQLCLIQLGTENINALVDPFCIRDFSPLARLFENENIVKIFHAASQDIEILYRTTGVTPKPVFDTQVAASLLGHAQQIGYGTLVKDMCGVVLPKADSYSDWSRRPLSDTQVKYAEDDVRYLPRIYRQMVKRLSDAGRLSWLDHDFEHLSDPATYTVDPYDCWRRVKRVSVLHRKQLTVAREVAAWRELHAQERDIPRKWILADEAIVEIAKRSPQTRRDLCTVRGIESRLNRKEIDGILKAVQRAETMPPTEWPQPVQHVNNGKSVDAIVDVMNAIVRLRADENNVAAPVLASRDDLSHLAHGEKNVPLLNSWRYVIVGKELQDFLEGKITISIEDGNLVIARTEEE